MNLLVNREIKFRALPDKNYHQMSGWYYGVDGTGKDNVFPMEMFSRHLKAGRLDIKTRCQYTGLKDKNDVEIYEGDIVKDASGLLYSVIWRKKRARFAYKCKQGSKTNMNQKEDIEDGIEAIGNIYENPELLGDAP